MIPNPIVRRRLDSPVCGMVQDPPAAAVTFCMRTTYSGSRLLSDTSRELDIRRMAGDGNAATSHSTSPAGDVLAGRARGRCRRAASTKCRLVELDLALAANGIGDFLPRRGHVVAG